MTANILFGISVPVFKHLLNTGMPPEAIAFLRAAVTCALFWLLSLFLPRQRVTHRDLGLLAVCGICGVGINQLLFVVGLKMTSPVDGSIIASSTPIFALLLAAVILREPVTKRKVLGVMLGVCGGLLLVFGTCACYIGREQSPRRCNDSRQLHSLFPLPRVVAILGATLFSRDDYEVDVPRGDRGVIPVFSRRTGKCCRFHAAAFPPMQLYGLLYITVGSTFIAFLLVTCSLKSLRPTTVSMYNYVQPMVACAIAIAIGQDVFSILKLGSLLLVFTGVYLVTTSRRRHEPVIIKS